MNNIVPAPSDLDPNKIAVELITANIDRLMSLGIKQLAGARNHIRVRLERTYQAYITRLLQRYSTTKSFFIRHEPVPLYSFFVPLDLGTDQIRLPAASAADVGAVSSFTIITGSGGSGKSMVMKHLLLSALSSRVKTPIFLELRNFDPSVVTIEAALLAALTSNALDIDDDFFYKALDAGHFLILIDGFDELDPGARSVVSSALQALALRFPLNWVVMSSRPDTSLDGWPSFTVLKVEPLDLDKAIALVERLAFDTEIKERFIRDLRSDLFERHQSFLSNPLLLSIMLLTYHDTASIPNKLSVFYNQAYESLFQKHDALKSGYQRPRRTQLDIQDFARVFAAFSVRTYSRRLFRFSLLEALSEVDKSAALSRVTVSASDYLDDAKQAVCLLVEEGADLTFSHRSFQEYFTAYFASTAPPQVKSKLIKTFAKNVGTDQVLPLLFELDTFAVEKHYVLPALRRIRRLLGSAPAIDRVHHRAFLLLLFEKLHAYEGSPAWSLTINRADLLDSVLFIGRRYLPSRPSAEPNSMSLLMASMFPKGGIVDLADFISKPAGYEAISVASGITGYAYFDALLALEATVSARHSEMDGSLASILG